MNARIRSNSNSTSPKIRQGANQRRRLQRKKAIRKARMGLFGRSGAKIGLTLGIGFSLLAGVSFLSWLAYQAYQEGKVLTINRIEVDGNQNWPTAKILKAAGLEVGKKWAEINSSKVCDNIRQLPGIQEVNLHRSLNGEIRMKIQEEKILALRHTKIWEGLTPTGAWMPFNSALKLPDLPVIEGKFLGAANSKQFSEFLMSTRKEFPEMFASFSQIVLQGSGEADIFWRDRLFKVRLDYANKSLNSLEFLKALLLQEVELWPAGSTVDLRVEGYAYVL